MSKSQRRCWKRNRQFGIEVRMTEPGLSQQHLDLFNAYHHDMHLRRSWPDRTCSAEEYAMSFLVGEYEFAFEFQYWHQDKLMGIGLVDLTPQAGSSVYFYHAPEWRQLGPGVFSMLAELQLAQQNGLKHHYLGYWIAACGSMAYKSSYGPHEILERYVADDEPATWKLPDDVRPSGA